MRLHKGVGSRPLPNHVIDESALVTYCSKDGGYVVVYSESHHLLCPFPILRAALPLLLLIVHCLHRHKGSFQSHRIVYIRYNRYHICRIGIELDGCIHYLALVALHRILA